MSEADNLLKGIKNAILKTLEKVQSHKNDRDFEKSLELIMVKILDDFRINKNEILPPSLSKSFNKIFDRNMERLLEKVKNSDEKYEEKIKINKQLYYDLYQKELKKNDLRLSDLYEKQIDDLKEEFRVLEFFKKNDIKLLESYKEQIVDLKEEIKALEYRDQVYERCAITMRNEVAASKAATTDAEQKIVLLQSQLAVSDQQIASLKSQIAAPESSIEELKKSYVSLKKFSGRPDDLRRTLSSMSENDLSEHVKYVSKLVELTQQILVEKVSRRADENLCVCCCLEKKNIILIPCNHMCVCEKCVMLINSICPLCRADVHYKRRVFV